MSTGLRKATLQEMRNANGDVEAVEGTEVEVQFNPESLRLTLRNQVEGGESRARQVRQHVGRSSTELSFDLVFDTADEIRDDGTARDVRERTAMVERFLVPKKEDGEEKPSPPMVRFHWGDLILIGVITNLSVDFELFSPDGTPLRAKTSVSIREQDPRYQYLEAGAGASEESPSSRDGSGGQGEGRPGEPGSESRGDPDRSDSTREGESLADFAVRQGLDPSRWRALADQVENPLSLPAGMDLPFDSTLGSELGVGARAGATGGSGASAEAGLGLEAAGGVLARGKALSGAGGLSAALTAAARASARAESGAERSAFGSAADGTAEAGASTGVGDSAVASAAGGGSAGGVASAGGSGDRRTLTFGRGVPLRPLRGGGAPGPAPVLHPGGGSPNDGGADGPSDPIRPSWEEEG